MAKATRAATGTRIQYIGTENIPASTTKKTDKLLKGPQIAYNTDKRQARHAERAINEFTLLF